jgi:hypothetical protein
MNTNSSKENIFEYRGFNLVPTCWKADEKDLNKILNLIESLGQILIFREKICLVKWTTLKREPWYSFITRKFKCCWPIWPEYRTT